MKPASLKQIDGMTIEELRAELNRLYARKDFHSYELKAEYICDKLSILEWKPDAKKILATMPDFD